MIAELMISELMIAELMIAELMIAELMIAELMIAELSIVKYNQYYWVLRSIVSIAESCLDYVLLIANLANANPLF